MTIEKANAAGPPTPLLQADDRTGSVPEPVDGPVGRVVVVGAGISGLSRDAIADLPPKLSLEAAMDELIPTIDPDVRPHLAAMLAMYEGQDADDVALGTFASLFFSGGVEDQDVFPSGGYRGVVQHLSEGLTIHVGTAVERIEQREAEVVVHTNAGPFAGTHAIVTVPLGVLKAGSVAFDPPLPERHRDAVDRMGFGAFEKVALEYERPVWQVDGVPTHLTVVDGGRTRWPVVLDMSAWYGTDRHSRGKPSAPTITGPALTPAI